VRTIAHLDVDAFYVSVELLRRPELRGRPVVVAGSGPRAVVTTASYEARRFGVGSAIPAARARRLCPDAVFLEPDFAHYRAVSAELMALVRAQVETVEVVGFDEAYLDLSGLVAPRAAMRRLVGAIRARTGLTCSVGIGPNRLVAKVASDAEKPAGFVVLTREAARARFADAAPTLLPGIGAKTAARLAACGIATVGALAAAPADLLGERFGPRLGPWLGARARFEDDAELTSERIAVSESRETTFPRDIADQGELERILGERLDDGGWNCEVENGSVRSSFDTTINVLDGLLEFERATGGSAQVRAARRSGEEYLLERGLFRRKSTGDVVDPAYLEFAFPHYWRYDVLRALDYFRRADADADPRMAQAVEVVRSKRQPDGRWLLDRIHPGHVHFDVESGVGTPSRWNTLRALRVLDWWDDAG